MKNYIKKIPYRTFLALFIFSMVSCKDKLTYDKNGTLLYENLTSKTEEYWDAAHSSLWIPVKKTRGPFMFLGETKYSGKIVKYSQNGNLEFEGTYSNGIQTGEWKYFFENGRIKSFLSEGQTYGEYYKKIEYYENGNIKSHFIGNSTRDTTYYVNYFKNGKLKYEHHFFTSNNRIEKYERRNLNGEVYEFFNEDSIFYKKDSIKLFLIERGKYQNRRKTGTWYKYSKPKSLLWIKNYSNDKLNGNFEEYYNSGAIKIKGKYSNGDKMGKWKEYYENGKTKIIANFKKDKLEGIYKEYYENGNIRERKEYYADEPFGIWIYYDENGEIWKKEEYK